MAYTIVKSDGNVLTTIADGTINTDSTSLGLPGRNYPGYGQTLDTNFVHILESFADDTPPQNPMRGQLWFDTNANTLYVCPTAGATSATDWLALTATKSGGETTFGSVKVTGNLTANNITATNNIDSSNMITAFNLTVSNNATIGNSVTANANIGTLKTTLITTGATNTNGNIIGTWTLQGDGTANTVGGTAMWITNGNLMITGVVSGSNLGIKTDNYMFANGVNLFTSGGAYSNANVAAYLPTYSGNVGYPGLGLVLNADVINAGAVSTPISLTGYLTPTTGSRLLITEPNTQANINTLGVGTITANANITSTASIYANSGTIGASLLTGTITVASAAQPNITSLGTLVSIAVTGNANAGNLNSDNKLVVVGNANVGNIGAQFGVFTGNVSAAGVKTDNIYYANGDPWDLQQPGGSNTQVQFNLNDNFGGSANLTFDNTTNNLTLTGNIISTRVYTTGYNIRSVGTGITAAGTTQGTATVLTKEFNVVSTISAGVSDGVKLPTAIAGMLINIVNTSTANLKVYPDTGAAINALGTNISYTQVGPNVALQYMATSSTQWYTLSSVYA